LNQLVQQKDLQHRSINEYFAEFRKKRGRGRGAKKKSRSWTKKAVQPHVPERGRKTRKLNLGVRPLNRRKMTEGREESVKRAVQKKLIKGLLINS